jgi:hypothetical protein
VTVVYSAYATETCQILHAEAFIAERRYRQLLIAAQAYKVHVLQSRRNAQQARRDAQWFQDQASHARAGMGYNPDWHTHHGMDGAKHFPGVAHNADNGISRFIFQINHSLNVAVFRRRTWPISIGYMQREVSFQINKQSALSRSLTWHQL